MVFNKNTFRFSFFRVDLHLKTTPFFFVFVDA